MPESFEKRQRERRKRDAKADKAWRRQLRREDRQARAAGLAPRPDPYAPEEGPGADAYDASGDSGSADL